jgi:predicted metallo-beta-lactamase superfamily hydrolase
MKVLEYVNDGQGNMVLIGPEPPTVMFAYCIACNQWEAVVSNVEDEKEAASALLNVMMIAHHASMAKAIRTEDGKFKVQFDYSPNHP